MNECADWSVFDIVASLCSLTLRRAEMGIKIKETAMRKLHFTTAIQTNSKNIKSNKYTV